MDERGLATITSLREIGDSEPPLMFSLRGLGVCDCVLRHGEFASRVLDDPVEASVNAPRLTEAKRPRAMGVFSACVVLLREAQEVTRALAWFFIGYLSSSVWSVSPMWRTYDGEMDVAGVQADPIPTGDA